MFAFVVGVVCLWVLFVCVCCCCFLCVCLCSLHVCICCSVCVFDVLVGVSVVPCVF